MLDAQLFFFYTSHHLANPRKVITDFIVKNYSIFHSNKKTVKNAESYILEALYLISFVWFSAKQEMI